MPTEPRRPRARPGGRTGALVPPFSYPDLPVSERREEIAAAIRDHQVVIVAGETGSGKTTQLPKIALELGRGVTGLIGHTQPRRIAARAVAERLAQELGVPVGGAVGYAVRFTDQVSDDTVVKVMTDGLLLAEIQRDRTLSRYDTIIVDEAHERSLPIDFLLGYLKALLPRRPDLKVVVTSATVDTARFSQHFDGAPVVEVSGRTYPVEVRYRPLVDPDDPTGAARDQTEGVVDAVRELCAAGPGDILVFLSGEREIRDTADALRPLGADRGHPMEVVPLYARLSTAEQHRVFAPHPGRRVVLATNVAETSLTVPGVHYVVDAGTARISRYSHRTKVQRLPIEPVSQASASQRAGRCGRVAAGVCIRLYSEADLAARPRYTDPEILRTHLASVILAMASLGLGEVADFPFMDPPDPKAVHDGEALLDELGALEPGRTARGRRLTRLGGQLARLPLDPRLARMVVAADRNGCVAEVLVLVSALSIQDPRERPGDHQQAAAQMHARFADPRSDFTSYLLLWRYLREQQDVLSSSAFRRLCRGEFLHYLRIREWQDLHAQLRRAVVRMGIKASSAPEGYDQIHQSVLAGLLSQIGMKDGRRGDFLGARGLRFALSPGSALARRPPAWVMAAELVETNRTWARTVARIDPQWAEALAPELVRRSYSEPHWSSTRGAVQAREKVLLYGLPLVTDRTVGYAGVDPGLCREMFIRHALVEGDWRSSHAFLRANRELLAEVSELEHRARRRDIVADDETLVAFYDQRLPAAVVSGRHFDAWWKTARGTDPDLLTFTRELLVAGATVSEQDYPVTWQDGSTTLRLTYQFDPGAQLDPAAAPAPVEAGADGVTAHVPLPVLAQVTGAGLDWQVPGLRLDLVTALLRSLPKQLRTSFVPVPDTARAALAQMSPDDGPLLQVLPATLERMTGVAGPVEAWDLARVPEHLRVTFRVEGDRGQVLGQGKDLAELRERLAPHLRTAVAAAMADVEASGLREWPLGTLPEQVVQPGVVHEVRGYPTLVDEGGSVGVRVLPDEAEARRSMWAGTRALLLLDVGSPAKDVIARLGNADRLTLASAPHAGVGALLADCLAAAVDAILTRHGGPVRDPAGYERLRAGVRAELAGELGLTVGLVVRVLRQAQAVDAAVRAATSRTLLATVTEVRAQVDALVHPGFVAEVGAARLPDLLRWLHAAAVRLDRAPQNPARDRDLAGVVQRLADGYARLLASLPASRRQDEDVAAVRWMLQELRVSLFAPTLKAAFPVSPTRVEKALAALAATPLAPAGS